MASASRLFEPREQSTPTRPDEAGSTRYSSRTTRAIMTKKDKWDLVVQRKNLDLTKPLNFVTADEVRQFSGEEPRLMASMTSADSLPGIFQRSGVFVLPVTNKKYAIVHGQGYHELEP